MMIRSKVEQNLYQIFINFTFSKMSVILLFLSVLILNCDIKLCIYYIVRVVFVYIKVDPYIVILYIASLMKYPCVKVVCKIIYIHFL